MYKQFTIPMVAGVLGLAMMAPAPASADQQKLYGSIGETLTETRGTREQLAATVEALTKLNGQTSGDLRPTFDEYVRNVEKTKEAAAVTRRRVDTMQSSSAGYFGEWKSTIDGISNADVKKMSVKRWTSVNKDYAKLLDRLTKANAKFQPYLADLSDIQAALSQDLTPKGMDAARKLVKKADKSHVGVRNEIMAAILQLEKMETDLKPEAAGK